MSPPRVYLMVDFGEGFVLTGGAQAILRGETPPTIDGARSWSVVAAENPEAARLRARVHDCVHIPHREREGELTRKSRRVVDVVSAAAAIGSVLAASSGASVLLVGVLVGIVFGCVACRLIDYLESGTGEGQPSAGSEPPRVPHPSRFTFPRGRR